MMDSRGFTLIELIITIAIVALLVSLAYPSLTGYLIKGQRLTAMQGLYQLQLAQEEWRINHATYANQQQASVDLLPQHANYTFSIIEASADYYQLQATANAGSAQQADKAGTIACHTLRLDRHDIKTPLPCWK